MIGQGVSSRSSHSSPAGRMTCSAKSWTQLWICFWSSLSSRENSAMGHLAGEWDGLVLGGKLPPGNNGSTVHVVDPAYPSSWPRSEEHTSELQSLMRISYAVFCLKKKKNKM